MQSQAGVAEKIAEPLVNRVTAEFVARPWFRDADTQVNGLPTQTITRC
jgi:hypothetical protein